MRSIIYGPGLLSFKPPGECAMTSAMSTSSVDAPAPARNGPSRCLAIAAAFCAVFGAIAPGPAAAVSGIEIAAFVVPEGLRVNDTVLFNVTVSNPGPADATGITVVLMDGNDTIVSSAPFDLDAGETRRVSLDGIIGGVAGSNHTFTAEASGASRSISRFVDRAPLPASIVIDSLDVSPAERNDLPPDSAGMFEITITLRNEGEGRGRALLRIVGMTGTIANDSFELQGGESQTKSYSWKVKGDRRHTSMATITGDVGSPSNMPAAADLHYKAQAPAFEAMLMLCVVAAVSVMAGWRKR